MYKHLKFDLNITGFKSRCCYKLSRKPFKFCKQFLFHSLTLLHFLPCLTLNVGNSCVWDFLLWYNIFQRSQVARLFFTCQIVFMIFTVRQRITGRSFSVRFNSAFGRTEEMDVVRGWDQRYFTRRKKR